MERDTRRLGDRVRRQRRDRLLGFTDRNVRAAVVGGGSGQRDRLVTGSHEHHRLDRKS
jgi:hypothetical protein